MSYTSALSWVQTLLQPSEVHFKYCFQRSDCLCNPKPLARFAYARIRNIKERESLKGRVTLVTKNVTIVKRRGHIQMMCKKFKNDLKRVRNLRDGGR